MFGTSTSVINGLSRIVCSSSRDWDILSGLLSGQMFSSSLQLVVVEGHRANLLGLDWFEPLGITVLGIHQVDQIKAEAIFKEFPSVFDDSLGLYKGPPISFNLHQAVVPICLRPRRVPK